VGAWFGGVGWGVGRAARFWPTPLMCQTLPSPLQHTATQSSKPYPNGCIRTRRQAILDVSGEVPQEAIRQLLAACRSGVFNRVQQQVRVAPARALVLKRMKALGFACAWSRGYYVLVATCAALTNSSPAMQQSAPTCAPPTPTPTKPNQTPPGHRLDSRGLPGAASAPAAAVRGPSRPRLPRRPRGDRPWAPRRDLRAAGRVRQVPAGRRGRVLAAAARGGAGAEGAAAVSRGGA